MLSLATDLAMGQPLEHGLRTPVLALRIAEAMGLSEGDQVTVFYTGLLHFAGLHRRELHRRRVLR